MLVDYAVACWAADAWLLAVQVKRRKDGPVEDGHVTQFDFERLAGGIGRWDWLGEGLAQHAAAEPLAVVLFLR